MITADSINAIAQSESIHEARKATLALLLPTISNDLRRADLRDQINAAGTVQQLVTKAWSMMLDQNGFASPKVVKAKRGMAYGK